MYSTSDFRNGLKILYDKIPYEITYFQHVKPGKGGAFVRTKLRNLLNGSIIENTFRAGDKVEKPDISLEQMQFLYSDDDSYHFMNTSTYDQIALATEIVGDKALFLKENLSVEVLFFNGSVINIDLPLFVELSVADCEPGVRGDTVSGATKAATLETGAKVQVPLFINQGETIKVDTRSCEYVERV